MKILKRVVLVLLVLSAVLYFTGNKHVFLGLFDTYLKGRSKPGQDNPAFFHTRVLESRHPKPWAVSKNYNQNPFSEKIKQVHTDQRTLAFLVIKNDSIVLEEYFEDYNKNKASNSFSMAKSFLSMITGVALKEGKIKLNDPVCRYLPEYVSEKDSALKIINLLNMTSGMNFSEDYGNPLGFMAKAYYGSDLKELMLGYHLEKKPGSEWKYLGGNNLLLSFLLEKALGEKVGTYAKEKLWTPLGMEHDGQWILDHENGDEKTFSGLYATARDFAKLGSLYLKMGNLNGVQIIDSNYIKQSITPVNQKDEDGKNIDYYGYAWWLTKYKGMSVYYMQGLLGQYVFCIPAKNLIIVRLGKNRMEKSNGVVPDDVYIYIEEGLRLTK